MALDLKSRVRSTGGSNPSHLKKEVVQWKHACFGSRRSGVRFPPSLVSYTQPRRDISRRLKRKIRRAQSKGA